MEAKWYQIGDRMVAEWSQNDQITISLIFTEREIREVAPFVAPRHFQVVVLLYKGLLLSLPRFFFRTMICSVFCFFQCTVAFDIRFNLTPEKCIENSYECWVHYKIKKHQRGDPYKMSNINVVQSC